MLSMYEKEQEFLLPPAASPEPRIFIASSGSRGDVQPYVALSKALMDAGFEVLLMLPPKTADLAAPLKIKTVLGPAASEAEEKVHAETMSSGDFFAFMKTLDEWWSAHGEEEISIAVAGILDFKPDIVIGTPLAAGGAVLPICRHLRIPLIYSTLQPGFATGELISFLGEPGWLPQWCHRLCWITQGVFFGLQLLKSQEQLPKVLPAAAPFTVQSLKELQVMMEQMPEPNVYGFSHHALVRPADWPETFQPCCPGFWTLSKQLQEEMMGQGSAAFGGEASQVLRKFLTSCGEQKPVYIGWGSMTARSKEFMAHLAVGALMHAGLKGVILGGSADVSLDSLSGWPDLVNYAQNNVLFVKSAAHEWLFPQCSVLVHHGGIGTMAAGLRSGTPSVVTPFFIDQYSNGALVQRLGVGACTPQITTVTPEALGKELLAVLGNQEVKQKAVEIAAQLQAEDGCKNTVDFIRRFWREVQTGKYWEKMDAHLATLKEMRRPLFEGCCAYAGQHVEECEVEIKAGLP